MTGPRNSIDHKEFRGNYALVHREELLEVIDAFKQGLLDKTALRAFAARLELKALHKRSNVDALRIVNASASRNRSLTSGHLLASWSRIDELIGVEPHRGPRRPVARRALRYIAQGSASRTEIIVLLYYFVRRKKQRTYCDRLQPEERYARFKYSDLRDLSGCGRASLCRAVARLRRQGLLELLYIRQSSVNREGNLFVDGEEISLVPQHRIGTSSFVKPTTAPRESDNAPPHFPTTLENGDPKTVISKKRSVHHHLTVRDGVLVASIRQATPSKEFARIQRRAQRAAASLTDKVA